MTADTLIRPGTLDPTARIQGSSAPASEVKGHVVLVHGLGANSWLMWPLARRLQQRGFVTHLWGYWSVGQALPLLIDQFHQQLVRVHETRPDDQPLHVIGHSLGSILARAVLAERELPEVKRLVMVCPPNRGSHVARLVGPYLRWLSPLVEDLSDDAGSPVNRLPTRVSAEVGVIAAQSDRVVRESHTHLASETDHIVLPGMHGDLIFRHSVTEQIESFLVHGKFRRPVSPESGSGEAADSRQR